MGRKHYDRPTHPSAEKIPEVGAVASDEYVTAGLHGSGQDGRVFRGKPFCSGAIDRCGARLWAYLEAGDEVVEIAEPIQISRRDVAACFLDGVGGADERAGTRGGQLKKHAG